MTVGVSFRGQLEYRDRAAVDALVKALDDEGYTGHPDNVLGPDDFHWSESGTTVTIATNGSMPYSCLDICTGVLALYAEHAIAGEIIVLNTEDRVGDRIVAGGESDELEEEEVEALLARER